MTYREQQGGVALQLTHDEWEELLLIVGFAVGAAMKQGPGRFWAMIDFANRLNAENPHFTPYEIPEEFRRR